MKLTCAGLTDLGRRREHNEDSFYLGEGSEALCIVADGMGGTSSGAFASTAAIQAIARYFRETAPTMSDEVDEEFGAKDSARDRQRLAESFQRANQAILEKISQSASRKGAATTIVGALFTSRGLYLGHVGDTRAYRLRGGELEQLTRDDSLLNEYIKRGLWSLEQADRFPYQNVVTKALGLAENVEVELDFHNLELDDLFLFCTDGLTDMVDEQDIRAIIEDEPDLEKLARRLVEQANAHGGDDNITVILARVEG